MTLNDMTCHIENDTMSCHVMSCHVNMTWHSLSSLVITHLGSIYYDIIPCTSLCKTYHKSHPKCIELKVLWCQWMAYCKRSSDCRPKCLTVRSLSEWSPLIFWSEMPALTFSSLTSIANQCWSTDHFQAMATKSYTHQTYRYWNYSLVLTAMKP